MATVLLGSKVSKSLIDVRIRHNAKRPNQHLLSYIMALIQTETSVVSGMHQSECLLIQLEKSISRFFKLIVTVDPFSITRWIYIVNSLRT